MSYAISGGHEKTVEVAQEILNAGGNAFDAAVAAYLVSFIAEPCMASAAAGGFANIFTKDGQSFFLDFFCQTPKVKKEAAQTDFRAVTIDFGTTSEVFYTGMGSVSTPGAIAGIFKIHDRFGSMPFWELCRPSIEAAKSGVRINEFQAYDFSLLAEIMGYSKKGQELFFQNNKIRKEGELLKMPDFADFLEVLAKEGRRFFYEGEIAQEIVKMSDELGGYIYLQDMRDYEAQICKPYSTKLQSHFLLTAPPPSMGGSLLILILKYLEEHLTTGDYLSENHLYQLANAIRKIYPLAKNPDALFEMVRPYLIGFNKNGNQSSDAKWGGTSHFNIVDKQGNAIALSTTIGEGASHFIQGTDMQLNNMLGEMALLPNGLHSWHEDVRLLSMMSPTIILDSAKKLHSLYGSGGAGRIPVVIAQVIWNVIGFQKSLTEASDAPRACLSEDILHLEPEWGKYIKNLSNTKLWSQKSLFFGGVHSVKKSGLSYEAYGDPRRFGVSVSG